MSDRCLHLFMWISKCVLCLPDQDLESIEKWIAVANTDV